MDSEKFKNIMGGVQSLVVSIAFVTGGIWTLVTFDILSQKERAEIELKEIT